MSVWNRIENLPEERRLQLFTFYEQRIPIEIRMHLAGWIESQNWSFYLENNNDERMEIMQRHLMRQFALEIEKLIEMINDVAYKYKLGKYHDMIVTSTESNSRGLIQGIRNCLEYEKEFLQRHEQRATTEMPSAPVPPAVNCFNSYQKLAQINRVIKDDIQQADAIFKNIKHEKEVFNIKQLELSCYDIPNNNDHLAVSMKKKLAEELNYCHAEYQRQMNKLILQYREILAKLMEVSNVLFHEVRVWKQQQKNQSDSLENLVQLKDLSELTVSNICSVWQQLKFIEALIPNDSSDDAVIVAQFIDIKKQAAQLFKNLISETFIVKNQPKQVIKKETKFDATVTLLAGSVPNVHMNSLVVRVQIINEEQAKLWHTGREKFPPNSCCGEIVNNTTMMEYNSTTNSLSANFINLRLKSFKRAEKKASIDKVVDEKFALLFTTEIYLENIKFDVSTISVPVVVIVHGNQKIHAWSTILWDNSFSELNRCPFNVPSEVKLADLAQVLSRYFYDDSRRHLSEDNVHFLAEKIAGRDVDRQNYRNMLVPWTKFSKDMLPEQLFSFWDWFYNIWQLTREHLSEIWAAGHIIGFITRQRAEALLMTKPPGTFLLRFSDTQLGGISVAFRNTKNQVECVAPFVSNDLKIRKLADRLKDFDQFIYLYPDIPKDTAFSKYYTRVENQVTNGYVPTQLRNIMPSETEHFATVNQTGDSMQIQQNPGSCSSNLDLHPTTSGASFSDHLSGNGTSQTNMSYDMMPLDWVNNPTDERSQNENETLRYFPIMNEIN